MRPIDILVLSKMEITIEAIAGPYSGKSNTFRKSPLHFGSLIGNDIRLPPESGVNGQHVRIFYHNHEWLISNLDSAKPILLNGSPFMGSPRSIQDLSIVQLGSSQFRFKLGVDTNETQLLDDPQVEPPPPPNPSNTRDLLIQEYLSSARKFLSTGVLDGQGNDDLRRESIRLGLTEAEVYDSHVGLYTTALKQAMAHGNLEQESVQDQIVLLKKSLKISDSSNPLLETAERDASRYLDLQAIIHGHMPTVPTSKVKIDLNPNEICHLQIQVSLLEERLGMHYLGNKAGTSVRIMRGHKFRFGTIEGHSIGERPLVTIANGIFALTSKRMIFDNDEHGFEAPWQKIMLIHPYTDGFSLNLAGSRKVHHFRYADPTVYEIVAGISQFSLNGK